MTNGGRYQLADLTMAGDRPWFAVHARDASGETFSWIISGTFQEERFMFHLEACFSGTVQAMVADEYGHIWAITDEDLLFTNHLPGDAEGWEPQVAHPQLVVSDTWYARRLTFVLNGQAQPELAECLAWVNGALLIGTFQRRLYQWESGGMALLEFDGHVPGALGGINNIVMTQHGIYALGYGGTLWRRQQEGMWRTLKGPWPEESSAFVNLIAGVEGPAGELWAIAAGGSVISVSDDAVTTIAQVPGEPLGIVRFQLQWLVSTLDGCYALIGGGGAFSRSSTDWLWGRALMQVSLWWCLMPNL